MSAMSYNGSRIAVALMGVLICGSAQAGGYCGYDRYGYHPPDFRDCYRYDGEGRRIYGARGFYPAYRYIRYPNAPNYPFRGDGCYLENGFGGFDRGILLVCPGGR